ncbi:MAG TPA: RdgB/HAM1 family non-canonical purine NTP pyrophosphatase, partial [Acidobacteriota bacterium]|nr:RdgB/HAM1 family non-canonical purine NTP pyrophosphatase [Acidobacteriota bacterium]
MKPGALGTIVIATRNQGKLREFRTLLRQLPCSIVSLADIGIDMEIDESGSTFAENARLKAVAYSRLTGLPVLADDSGLEVKALGGRPGIHSARYAGPGASDADRIAKLLEELDRQGGDRTARFVCALALARSGSIIRESEGTCSGIILREPRGTNGFGYDPVFLMQEFDRTFAELNEDEKNRY